jgi:hypothetical protein
MMRDLTTVLFNELTEPRTEGIERDTSKGKVTQYVTQPSLLEVLRESIFNPNEKGASVSAMGPKLPLNAVARDLYEQLESEATALYVGAASFRDGHGREIGLKGQFKDWEWVDEKWVSGPSDLTFDATVAFSVKQPRVAPLGLVETISGWLGSLETDRQTELAARILGRWINRIESMLNPMPNSEIVAPCPQCGTKSVSRRQNGEDIVQPALQIIRDKARTPIACRCQHCGTSWEPNQWEFLANLLGAKPLPNIDSKVSEETVA